VRARQKKIARNAKHRARLEQRVKPDQPPLEDDVGEAAVEASGGAIVAAAGGSIAVEAAGGVIVSAGAVVAGAAIVEDAAAPFSPWSLLLLHAPSATTSADARTIRVNFMCESPSRGCQWIWP